MHRATEASLVPDPSLSIRERAIAAWPGAWQGKNLREILATMGYDVDRPWRDLPQADRDWILFTDEQPVVTVHAHREAHRIQRPYQGTYQSARRYVLQTLANTGSATLRRRVLQYVEVDPCPRCAGTGLRPEALAVTYGGRTVSELTALPLSELARVLADGDRPGVAASIVPDLLDRIEVLAELGLGYLSTARSHADAVRGRAAAAPAGHRAALAPVRGALRARRAVRRAAPRRHRAAADGARPAPRWRQLAAGGRARRGADAPRRLDRRRRARRRHRRRAGAAQRPGRRAGRRRRVRDPAVPVPPQTTGRPAGPPAREPRPAAGTLALRGVSLHNLRDLDVDVPLGVFTAVTGVSGSGKSTLVTRVLADVVRDHLGAGTRSDVPDEDGEAADEEDGDLAAPRLAAAEGLEAVTRLVVVDQRPIGRTPRSNLATYTGLFDGVRKLFAATPEARERGYAAGRFSFNVAGGRCENCQGEGFVAVELLFLPGSYAPCPVCLGARYHPDTLEVRYRDRSVADVLAMTVDDAAGFFADVPAVSRSLETLRTVGLGYLTLGQPATELSGGEAQRIKLSSELQRARRGHTLYLLDEPTAGLHPVDVALLTRQLHDLVEAGSTVVVVEHDLDVVAGADHVLDLGPGGGDDGGRLVAAGTPAQVAGSTTSRTAPYLAARLRPRGPTPQP